MSVEPIPHGGVASFTTAECPSLETDLIKFCDRDGDLPNFLRLFDERFKDETAFIATARKDPGFREIAKRLASWGYLQYMAAPGEAKLIHRDRIPTHWDASRDGLVKWSSGGVGYALDEKGRTHDFRKLLVIFSHIHPDYNSPLLWRYFVKAYRHMGGLTTGDTAILRIADIGGVVGSFYSDTKDKPNNARAVFELIEEIMKLAGLSREDVCLLGSSKGASAAVQHGLSGNFPFVAVDPILNDQYYEVERNDAHFTGSPVFLESKEHLFSRLAQHSSSDNPMPTVFFTANGSRQRSEVFEYAGSLRRPVTVICSQDPAITRHEEVAPGVLGPTVSAVNALLLGMKIPNGTISI